MVAKKMRMEASLSIYRFSEVTRRADCRANQQHVIDAIRCSEAEITAPHRVMLSRNGTDAMPPNVGCLAYRTSGRPGGRIRIAFWWVPY
jgi:hypothetical protein